MFNFICMAQPLKFLTNRNLISALSKSLWIQFYIYAIIWIYHICFISKTKLSLSQSVTEVTVYQSQVLNIKELQVQLPSSEFQHKKLYSVPKGALQRRRPYIWSGVQIRNALHIGSSWVCKPVLHELSRNNTKQNNTINYKPSLTHTANKELSVNVMARKYNLWEAYT